MPPLVPFWRSIDFAVTFSTHVWKDYSLPGMGLKCSSKSMDPWNGWAFPSFRENIFPLIMKSKLLISQLQDVRRTATGLYNSKKNIHICTQIWYPNVHIEKNLNKIGESAKSRNALMVDSKMFLLLENIFFFFLLFGNFSKTETRNHFSTIFFISLQNSIPKTSSPVYVQHMKYIFSQLQ